MPSYISNSHWLYILYMVIYICFNAILSNQATLFLLFFQVFSLALFFLSTCCDWDLKFNLRFKSVGYFETFVMWKSTEDNAREHSSLPINMKKVPLGLEFSQLIHIEIFINSAKLVIILVKLNCNVFSRCYFVVCFVVYIWWSFWKQQRKESI